MTNRQQGEVDWHLVRIVIWRIRTLTLVRGLKPVKTSKPDALQWWSVSVIPLCVERGTRLPASASLERPPITQVSAGKSERKDVSVEAVT